MEILKKIMIVLFLFIGISANSQSVEKAFSKSYALENDGKYDEASAELIKIYDKKSYAMNIRLAWLTYLSGQLPQSIRYYDICIKLKPLSIEALLGKTYPESVLGNWQNVIAIYEKIIKFAPNNYTANLNLAQIYLNTEKYSKAEPIYKLILNQYPFTYDVVIGAAWNNYYLGKLREAKVLFNQALLLYPGNESATQGLEKIK